MADRKTYPDRYLLIATSGGLNQQRTRVLVDIVKLSQRKGKGNGRFYSCQVNLSSRRPEVSRVSTYFYLYL
ncbi:hypothetical protein P8452_28395 [Trifolium repens]|nr:hypothetical protein P8452_28395 [Trifolium repens]